MIDGKKISAVMETGKRVKEDVALIEIIKILEKLTKGIDSMINVVQLVSNNLH